MEENEKIVNGSEIEELPEEELKAVSGGCNTPGFSCYICEQHVDYDARHHYRKFDGNVYKQAPACDSCYESHKDNPKYQWYE